MTLVRIIWRDAEDIMDTWSKDKKVQNFSLADFMLESVGYLVRKTDKYVTIAGDWDVANKKWGAVRKFPTAVVLDIKELEL